MVSEGNRLIKAAEAALEWFEEEDPHPTSDEHPIHELREVLYEKKPDEPTDN